MACKYYNKHMDTILEYCKCLYKFEGCAAGGMLHIVLDDGNIENNHILFCLNECIKHPEAEEAEIGKLICMELLKLSMNERKAFYWYWNGFELPYIDSEFCDTCDGCNVLED